MKLSIGYITARKNFEPEWFLESLRRQIKKGDEIEIWFIDSLKSEREPIDLVQVVGISPEYASVSCGYAEPKPCVWSGRHRITKENWWSKCNSINTFLCLAKHDFISTIDDRCVLIDGWLDSIRKAQSENTILAGSYEKRYNMTVEDGHIKNGGIITAKDQRSDYSRGESMKCGGEWLFGCCLAMPLEWALSVNGLPEDLCDGLSFEDVIYGLCLQNNGYPMMFEPKFKMIEDRTPELLGNPIRRTDKGISPNDKSHKVLEIARTTKKFTNWFGDIRELRSKIQAGGEWPIPNNPDAKDWFDGKLIREIV